MIDPSRFSIRFAILLCLCIFSFPLSAEIFSTVSVEQIPVPENGSPEGMPTGGIMRFKVANLDREKEADITFIYRGEYPNFEARRRIVIPPDTIRNIDFIYPSLSAYWNLPTMLLDINGKIFKTNFSFEIGRNYQLVAPEVVSTLPVNEIDIFNYDSYRYGSSSLTIPSVLASAQWPDDIRFYANKKTIFVDSSSLPPPATMKTLENWVALGGNLVITVKDTSPMPDFVPDEYKDKDYYLKNIIYGKLIVCRPFKKDQLKSFMADYKIAENKNSNRDYNSSSDDKIWENFYKQYPPVEQLRNALRDTNYLINKISMMGYAKPPVPVTMLTIGMGIFILLIGPVNYLILKKMRKEMLVLATIPAISALFCIAVIIAITISEGWHSRGRANTITCLDQTTGKAVTHGTFIYYSPLYVRSPFLFKRNELVTLSSNGTIRLDTTNEQLYAPSILVPREPLQISIASIDNVSEKLRVTLSSDGKTLEVVNGLGRPVSQLMILGSDGAAFYSKTSIPQGEKVILERSNEPIVKNNQPDYNFILHAQPKTEIANFKDNIAPGYYIALLENTDGFCSSGIKADKFESQHVIIGKYGDYINAN